MSSLRAYHPLAISAAFLLVGVMAAACGGDDGDGSGGSGGGGAGGPSALCSDDVSGQATPVTITVRNTGATDLQIPTQCVDAWAIAAPGGATAPRGWFSISCDNPPADCPLDCLDLQHTTLAAGTDTTFTWDGLLVEQVDAVAESCPAAQPAPGDFCPNTCGRDVDAPAGMYTLTVQLFQNDVGVAPKTVMFSYPDQTAVEVVFP